MKFKIPYSIRKSLIKILPFVATAIMSTACHKEPYDVIIDWDWNDQLGFAPPKEMISRHTNNKYVETVYINLILKPEHIAPNSTGFAPKHFRFARDSLQSRIDISPEKVRGMGTVYVGILGGSQQPDYNQNGGMALVDSIWFTDHGWRVQRWNWEHNHKSK